MKTLLLICALTIAGISNASAQEDTANSAIKFYLSVEGISTINAALPDAVRGRIFRKFSQLINQTGIAEVGYSTFLVSPKMDVLKVSEDQAGIGKVFMAECEISILIWRTSPEGVAGEGVFNSFSKTIIGSGSSKDDAIANALNSLSGKDKEIVAFFVQTKTKINNYFAVHCKDVIKEANLQRTMKNYEGAVALFLSIPNNAPCHDDAEKMSEGVFVEYIEAQCQRKLIGLKTFVALAQKEDRYYDSVMVQINLLNKASLYSATCLTEAKNIVSKIENRLTEQQKKEWEQQRAERLDNKEMRREMYKAMGRISSTYQPSSASGNIIIAH